MKKKFIETTHCTSQAHCKACRTNEKFRRSIMDTFEWDGECPHGYTADNYPAHPTPKSSNTNRSPTINSEQIFGNEEILKEIYPELESVFDDAHNIIKNMKCSQCAKNGISRDIFQRILKLSPKGRDLSKLSSLNIDEEILKVLKGDKSAGDLFPSKPKLISTFTKAVGKAVKRFTEDGELIAPEEVRQARLRICAECDHNLGWRCGKCGCYLDAKVVLISERCDIDKW